jgi:hypothetical protein
MIQPDTLKLAEIHIVVEIHHLLQLPQVAVGVAAVILMRSLVEAVMIVIMVIFVST